MALPSGLLLVLREVLRGSLAFPLTDHTPSNPGCASQWFLLSEGSCHGNDLGPHSPINKNTREMTAKLCTQSSAPPAAPCPRGPSVWLSSCERLSSPGYLPSCRFLSISANKEWPQMVPASLDACHLCASLLLGISTAISLSIHSTLRGTLRKTHWLEFTSSSTVPSPFPASFSPGI